MNKNIGAVIASILMTLCIGLGILAIGGVALFNPNGVAAANSPTQAPQASSISQGDAAQLQQLQALLVQYQQREVQYQQREAQYQSQLSTANNQLQMVQQQNQQYQSLVTTLEQRGIITIDNTGQVFINR